jgi:hypothetical protein
VCQTESTVENAEIALVEIALVVVPATLGWLSIEVKYPTMTLAGTGIRGMWASLSVEE